MNFMLRILIVEDNKTIQDVHKHILEKTIEGAQVDVAGNSRDAASLLELGRYDFHVLDGRFPGSDGIAMAGLISNIHDGEKGSIAIFTGDEKILEQARRMGYAVFSKEDLRETLYEHIRIALVGSQVNQMAQKSAQQPVITS